MSGLNVIQSRANKEEYLNRNKDVRLEQYRQKKIREEDSGLKDIEVRKRKKVLGKNDFLKLLAVQLTHQDPTKPMKDTQFVAQMAQFSSLEQMNNMAGEMTKMKDYQSLRLIGKYIMGNDLVSGDQIHGRVNAVFFDKSGKPVARLDNGTVNFKEIILVSEKKIK